MKEQMTSVGAYLDNETRETLPSFPKENVNIFAWKPVDMPNIDKKISAINWLRIYL